MSKGKPRVKVAMFLPKWLDKSIDGEKVSRWLTPDLMDKTRAMCLLCPSPNSFSITEGWRAVKQHNTTKKHVENMEVSQRNPDFRQVGLFS
jgi:hypothetical protein